MALAGNSAEKGFAKCANSEIAKCRRVANKGVLRSLTSKNFFAKTRGFGSYLPLGRGRLKPPPHPIRVPIDLRFSVHKDSLAGLKRWAGLILRAAQDRMPHR